MDDILKQAFKLKNKKMGKPPTSTYKAEKEKEYDPDLVNHEEPTWKQELARENRDSDMSKESSVDDNQFYETLKKRLVDMGSSNETIQALTSKEPESKVQSEIDQVRDIGHWYKPILGADFVDPGDIVARVFDNSLQDRFMVVKVEKEINRMWIWDPIEGAIEVSPEEYVLVSKTSPEVAKRLIKRVDKIQQRPNTGLYSL